MKSFLFIFFSEMVLSQKSKDLTSDHTSMSWAPWPKSRVRSRLLPGENFTNVLRAPFLYKSALRSFSLFPVRHCNFLAKEYWHKSCSKMLLKLTTGDNFTNFSHAAFSYKRVFPYFLYLHSLFVIFSPKKIFEKVVPKMLVILVNKIYKPLTYSAVYGKIYWHSGCICFGRTSLS